MSIILSIKPCFSDQIYMKNKPLELRKRLGKAFFIGTKVYIYSSSPVKAITGVAEINKIERLPVTKLKEHYLGLACISATDFDEYYKGHKEGYALWLTNINKFVRPITLEQLRQHDFTAPQSFCYMTEKLQKLLKDKL